VPNSAAVEDVGFLSVRSPNDDNDPEEVSAVPPGASALSPSARARVVVLSSSSPSSSSRLDSAGFFARSSTPRRSSSLGPRRRDALASSRIFVDSQFTNRVRRSFVRARRSPSRDARARVASSPRGPRSRVSSSSSSSRATVDLSTRARVADGERAARDGTSRRASRAR
jgi:hypothetical protein